MLHPAKFCWCLLVLAAGCASPSSRTNADRPEAFADKAAPRQLQALKKPSPGPRPPNWHDPSLVVTNVAGNAPAVWPATNRPALAPTNAVAPTNRILPPLEMTWQSLTQWAAEQDLPPPRILSQSPVASYALENGDRRLAVQIGSRIASWNNLELRLGFTPQLIEGDVYVHTLDLRRNIEPLLLETTGQSRTNPLVVIDPGHGGPNGGTRSVVDGSVEKDYTLDWALRLAPLLEACGWRVSLTRTNDVELSLSNRVAFAEAQEADLFVSLHFNASGGGQDQSGVETYCLTPTGMPSTLTRGYEDDLDTVLPNNAYDAENLLWAMRFHGALLRATDAPDRGVRRARFLGVLRNQRRPAVLIEGGYLSNPDEARRIADPAYRQKLAEALAEAFGPRVEE